MIIPGGPEKTSRTFAWRYATEHVSKSAESMYVMSKHLRMCLGNFT